MPAVTAFGADYSARELSPREINAYNAANPGQPIKFLIRYIGYPTNGKCISAYPGALAAHEANGTLVLLVHQIGYLDFHGGYAAGQQHAQIALADARRQGYPENRPIFFAFDRWLAGNPSKGIPALPIAKVWEYLAGAQRVLGGERVGLYGFYDVIHPAIREGRVRWTWLCGAESGVVDGVHFYQWNNGRIYPGGMDTDLNKSYVDLSIFGGDDMSAKAEEQIGHISDALGDAYEFDGTTRKSIGTRVKDMDTRLGYVEKALGDAYDPETDTTIGDRVKATEADVKEVRADVRAIREDLAKITVGGIDYAALAKAVNDDTAKRLQS